MRKSRVVVICLAIFGNLIFFQNCSKNQSGSAEQGSAGAESANINRTVISTSNLQSFEAAQRKVEASWLQESSSNNSCLPQDLYPKTIIPPNLKYLSMVDEFLYVLPFDNYWKSETNEESKYGNVITLAVNNTSSAQLNQLDQKLAYLKTINRKAVINVQDVFYDKSKLEPWSDYREKWNTFAAVVKKHEDIVVSFYLYDEPFWNAQLKNVPEATVYDYLTIQNRIIKNSFPAIATTLVEAYTMINDKLRVPPGIDWVGLDCYNSFDHCGNPQYGYRSIPEYYAILKRKITPYQKLVAIPNGIILDEKYIKIESRSGVPLSDRLNTVDIADKYFRWIATEKRIVGAFTFIYKYRGEAEGVAAASDMCEVAEHFEKNGQKFLKSNHLLTHVNALTVNVVAQAHDKQLSLVENKSVDISSLKDVSIKFNITSNSDIYNLRCEVVSSKGAVNDCSAHLQSGFVIPANTIENYRIQLSQGALTKYFGINILAQPKKSCVYEGETTPDGCRFPAVTLAHGISQTLQSSSAVVGSVSGTCNDGQWINVQKSCTAVKKSCSYLGETTPEGCKFQAVTAKHGESRTLSSISNIPGTASGTCDDGKWIKTQLSCVVPKKSCSYGGETTPQGCRFSAVTVPHGESRTLQSVSSVVGSASGTCNDGQWVNTQITCVPPKKSCSYAGGAAAGGSCIFPAITASHGEFKSVNAVSGGTGIASATCNDGQWVNLQASCR
ncbi:hypothetical protein K2P97_05515 [bacterium]|nr:hypothetical protein [bacterium]